MRRLWLMTGRFGSFTDGRGNATAYHYDVLSQVDWTEDVLSNRTSYAYDTKGRATVVADPLGNTNNTAYDNKTNTYGYAFDPIGNRISTTENAKATEYSANELNRYVLVSNSVTSVSPWLNAPIYDADGNMTFDGREWHYAWNGENQLALASNATCVVRYAYDYCGNMTRKEIFDVSNNYKLTTKNYTWDGDNIIAETTTDHYTLTTDHCSYVWGLDLSGTLQGAGGAGGLLAIIRTDGTFFPVYDANGNITGYADASGAVRARYAYDAYGNVTAMSGDLAGTFRFRFSTKYHDPETGLCYYGGRFYSPELGRWLNRDPVGERGGLNLYGFVGNDPANYVDVAGRYRWSPWPGMGPYLDTEQGTYPQTPAGWGTVLGNWFFELEGTPSVYGPDSTATQSLRDMPGVENARAAFRRENADKKKCEDFKGITHYEEFSYRSPLPADFWTVPGHILGSYNVAMEPNCSGELKITVTDNKSWKSLFRFIPGVIDAGMSAMTSVIRERTNVRTARNWWQTNFPDIKRSKHGFGGKVDIEFRWDEKFDCECPCK